MNFSPAGASIEGEAATLAGAEALRASLNVGRRSDFVLRSGRQTEDDTVWFDLAADEIRP